MSRDRIAALALIALLAAAGSHAAEPAPKFELIQSQCVAAGKLSRAALDRSAACAVTRGRWFSTIEHDDFYQAQYCLGATTDAARCQQRGLLLFANRAYTPTARLTLERIDPAGTEYDDPQVYLTAYGYLLSLTVRPARGAPQTGYYRWQNDRWQAIDTVSWQSGVAARLPPGSRLDAAAPPELDTLQSRVAVFGPDDPACCAGAIAEIDFALAGDRLAVKSLRLTAP